MPAKEAASAWPPTNEGGAMQHMSGARRSGGLILILALALAACSQDTTEPANTQRPEQITLLTHDAFAVSDGILQDFTNETGVEVQILTSDDAGTMLNQAILTKDNPIADVMYGIDNTFLSRAVSEGIFEPYTSSSLSAVPESLRAGDQVTPIDYGDVCINYDKAAFENNGPSVPLTLQDLTDPAYGDMLVVEDPATSSPGLAFMLATIAKFGETGDYTWQDYWRDLTTNGVKVDAGWTEAYYSDFSAASDGTRPLVVSYASSPPAEVYYSEVPLDEPPTGVLTDGCFRQVEYAGILAGTGHAEAAGKLIDFMLSPEFQEDMPLNMFVFPARSDATLPSVFAEFATVPDHPETMDPGLIEQHREEWIQQWTEIVRS
jgi:thiamine transport system substrate-binding protein